MSNSKNHGSAALLAVFANSASVITLNGFDDISKLVLKGDAATAGTGDGTVLRLAPALPSKSGGAFSKARVNAKKFSTFFKFRISQPDGSIFDCNTTTSSADGLVYA